MNGSVFCVAMGRSLCSPRRASRQLLVGSTLSVIAASFSPSLRTTGVSAVQRNGWFSVPSDKMQSRRLHRWVATRTDLSDTELEVLAREEFQDVLPFEKGSHRSAKLVIPTDLDDVEFGRNTFQTRLKSTIAACRELGKSSLWVYVPMSRASLIEDMAAFGVKFHHASGDMAVLNVWLQESSESKIPEFATHIGKSHFDFVQGSDEDEDVSTKATTTTKQLVWGRLSLTAGTKFCVSENYEKTT